MLISAAIRHAAQGPDSSRDVARAFLDTTPPDLLVAMLAEEIDHWRRACTRVVERQALPNGTGQRFLISAKTVERLNGHMFAVGDGQRVRWELATVAQHRQRIDMLLRLRRGLEETIERHHAAIDAIEAAGVSCLAEVPETAADLPA